MTVEEQIRNLRAARMLEWLEHEFVWAELDAPDVYTAHKARQTLMGALDILRGYGATCQAESLVARKQTAEVA